MTTTDAPQLRIGSSARACLILEPTRREFQGNEDYWDGNWVYTTVTIAAGSFRGKVGAMLRPTEFHGLRDGLVALHTNLSGRARFDPMEPWLKIDIEGDGKGHFSAACVAVDRLGTGNRLVFTIGFDQTEIGEMVRGIDSILAAFPVVGATGGTSTAT